MFFRSLFWSSSNISFKSNEKKNTRSLYQYYRTTSRDCLLFCLCAIIKSRHLLGVDESLALLVKSSQKNALTCDKLAQKQTSYIFFTAVYVCVMHMCTKTLMRSLYWVAAKFKIAAVYVLNCKYVVHATC